MTLKSTTFKKSIRLKPDTDSILSEEGTLKVDSSSNLIKAYLGAAVRDLVTADQTQTLTNKTIDADNNTILDLELDNLKAGVLNTSTSLSGATDLQVPSALAVKTYVDNGLSAQNDASEITNTPAGTIAATNVQAAINELDGDIQAHLSDTVDAHDASAISNVPSGNLAATDVQAALNELQSDIDTRATTTQLNDHLNDTVDAHDASAISSVPSGNLAATDVQSALNELQSDIDTRALNSALTSHTSASSGVHGVTGSVVGTTDSQTLTNKIITGADIRTPVRLDVKQDTKANLTTYATTASNGQLCFATDTKEMFQVVDGLLKAVGGGGADDVNALLIQTFDAASLTDFTQTGLSLIESNTLNGEKSARLTHQPASSQSFKQTISVDRKFRGKLMQLSLAVQSTATQGNLTLNVYNETGAANIVASEQITLGSQAIASLSTSSGSPTISGFTTANINSLVVGERVTGSGIPAGSIITAVNSSALTITISQNATATASGLTLRFSDVVQRRTVSFTIPASCASMSYTITAAQESGSPESYVDDVVIELSETALLSTSYEVSNVTAWQGYTPSFQGFGTPTNVEFEWRQVGENVEIRGKFVTGTPTAVEARVGLPGGLTSAGTGIIPSIQMVGKVARSASNTTYFSASALIEPSVTYLTIGRQTSTTNELTKETASNFVNSGETVSFFASVPCAGLSANSTKTIALTQSGLIQESDSMIRVDTVGGYGATATCVRYFNNITQSLGSDVQYTRSTVNGDSFTILNSGVYSISYCDTFNSAANMGISRNASSLTTNIASLAVSERLALSSCATTNLAAEASWTGYLNAGDIIRAQADTSPSGSTPARANFTITRQASLKQVSVNTNSKITIPTSELRMEGASTRGAVATAVVRFDSVARVRGDAFSIVSDANNGTAITILKAGKLDISTSLYGSVARYVNITRNQANLTALPIASEILAGEYTAGTDDSLSASWSGNVQVGDIIRVHSSAAPTANVTNSLNLSFQEQDIAVNVTNTLPQFSESDSSVRVDTANGYGSTATRIRRFSNIRSNIGADITYNPNSDEATNGASFRINSAGIYNISYSEAFSASSDFGISLNASSLTTNVGSLASSEVLAISSSASVSFGDTVSWQGYLNAGDIIRPHSAGTSAGAGNAYTKFTISKVGKPNVTGVNVTPFVNIPQPNVEVITHSALGSTLLDNTEQLRFNISNLSTTNKGIISIQDDVTNSRTRFVALKKCIVTYHLDCALTGTNSLTYLLKNGTNIAQGSHVRTAGDSSTISGSINLEVGDFLVFGASLSADSTSAVRVCLTAEALSDQIVTAPEIFSTDTASLQYASSSQYTLSTLANAPVGTFITFTYAASTNTRTQTTTAPTQTTADMNTNGIRLFYRTGWAAATTAAQPACIAIQLGKGLKGWNLSGYSATGKVGSIENDLVIFGINHFGFTYRHYNESTGILLLDVGSLQSTSGATNTGFYVPSTGGAQFDGYFTINASKNPALTGLNLVQPRIATISDVKSSGTAGGTFTAGSYITRTLNTLEDPTGIVTSLASNQFILPAGEYYIEAYAPASMAGSIRAKIRNITDSTDAILSDSGYITPLNNISGFNVIQGRINITSSKTFELQHRCGTTRASDGLGNAVIFGDSEIYSRIKITRIK